MSNLLIGVLGAVLATNQPAALSNLVTQTTGVSVPVTNTNSPIAQELHKIEEQDDAAAAEVDDWIRQNDEFTKKGAGIPKDELNQRIRNKFDGSRTAYKDFIQRHPDYAPARVAYASFLHDMGDEDGELEQLLKARDLDATIPSVWNNLANHYGEHSPVTNAFACYEKAIQLDPKEPVYYDNFGTTVYLFRKDAKEYYHINEQQVFDKALALYGTAIKLDPTNFLRASDLAMSYYGIKPLRTNDALNAWTNALSLARDEVEREGVYIHFARLAGNIGQFAAAHKQLEAVTNEMYTDMKRRLIRSLNDKEHPETELSDVTSSKSTASESFPPLTNAVTDDVTAMVKRWQQDYDQGKYANEQSQLPQIKVFGQDFASVFMLVRTNNGFIASTAIPSAEDKALNQGTLWTLKNQDPFSGKVVKEINLFGLVWTPRTASIGKLDLTNPDKITTNSDFDLDEFKSSPGVIPFANGYAVNLFGQKLQDNGLIDENSRHGSGYITDTGKPLYARLIRSRFGKVEEIILSK